MDKTVTREIDRFEARSGAGKVYMLVIFQNYVIKQTALGGSIIPTTQHATTLNGSVVNRLDQNTYLLVATNEKLVRI